MNLSEETIKKMAAGTWVPPVKRLDATAQVHAGYCLAVGGNVHDDDCLCSVSTKKYNELVAHHQKETTALLEVVAYLAQCLVDKA